MKTLSSFLCFTWAISLLAQAHDGTVNVQGTILDNTCIVSAATQQQTVPLGDISAKQFSASGSASSPVAFVIDLQDCGAAASGVDFTFGGVPSSADETLLALESGSGSAADIAIELQDANHQRLPLNQASTTYKLDPARADNPFTFYARYIATANSVTSGEANATATFTLTWQ